MAIDTEAIKEHIKGIIEALGDDPEREGLKETPDRVARMYAEVFEGMNYSNEEIANMFDKTFEQGLDTVTNSKDMVLELLSVHHIHSVVVVLDRYATIVRYLWSTACTLLSSDEDDTVRCTRTVDSSCRRILKYCK